MEILMLVVNANSSVVHSQKIKSQINLLNPNIACDCDKTIKGTPSEPLICRVVLESL